MTHSTVFERAPADPAVVAESLRRTRHDVFWLDDVATPVVSSAFGSISADLVVVGAGYTGLWTAIRALEREPGRRVVVLEAKTAGWAASGRNGGFLEASLTHGTANGRRRWPEELATLEHLGQQNLEAIVETVGRYGIQADLERTGTLSVAVEPHQLPWLTEEPPGDDILFDEAGVRAEIDSPTYLGGRWERHATALVHPAKLVRELQRVARELGAVIHEGSPVRSIDAVDDGVEVLTADATVRTSHVALATNAFPSLLRRNRLMTVPVYDYVLMTEPLSAAQLASIGWRQRQGVTDLANQFHYYRLTADDRILFGGYDAVYHPGGRIRARYEDRAASYRRLATHFFTTFPQLEGLRFSHRWAGVIDTSTRFCAFFGTARRGRVAYASGFTGLGIGASRFAADVLLDLLGGEPTERTDLRMVRERPLPFPPEPIATVGIQTVRHLLDRSDHREGRRGVLLGTLDALGLGFDS